MAARDQKVDLIASVSLFKGLGRRELDEIAQLLDEVAVPAGKVLMRQGEPGSEMFIIASGRFRIERNGQVLREVGPGTSIGDISLIAEGPRTATVTATEASVILLAGHREFHRLMDEHPTIRSHILEGLATKVRLLDVGGAH